jgi:signal transduction histidine kinase
MSQLQLEDDEEVILVEFETRPGLRQVSLGAQEMLEKAAESSKKAIERAMKSMRGMAKRTMQTIREIPLTDRPNSLTVAFGLKLDAEAGAVVAKAGAEATINVTMTWTHADKEK